MKVSIDSRTIRAGEIFVAIKGARFDGRDFICEAISSGAEEIIIPESIEAFGELAHLHRLSFDIPVIAITGSNGKTTTKELTAALLEKDYRVLKNEGTKNNDVGLPWTLLNLEEFHSGVVLEMGANHPGEIRMLSKIASADIGVITNIGAAHLESFGDLEGVFNAKMEIAEGLRKDGILIVNGDDEHLNTIRNTQYAIRIIKFGIENEDVDFRAKDIVSSAKGCEWTLNERRYRLPVPGKHNIYNALAAIACARILGVSFANIEKALAEFKPLPMRLNCKKMNGVTVIDDTYNSNPISSYAAIDTIVDFSGVRQRIVVFGDMLELGARAQEFHKAIGRYIGDSCTDILIAVGEFADSVKEGALEKGMENVWSFGHKEQAAEKLFEVLEKGDLILIKGSRGLGMESLISKLSM